MIADLSLYGAALVAAFGSTFLRGFQNKNTAGGHKKLAFLTGCFMYLADAAVITILVKVGPSAAAASSVGAGLGYWVSMTAHDWLMRKHYAEAKTKKRAKELSRIEKLVDARLKEFFEVKGGD